MSQANPEVKFLAIKKLCNSINKEAANAYATIKEKNSIIEKSDNRIDVSELGEEIRALCRQFSIEAAPPTGIRSGIRETNGEWISFIAFAQMFKKEAPSLTDFVIKLARRFVIEPDQEKYVKIKPTLQSNLPRYLATYFIGGEQICAVNLATGKILKNANGSMTEYLGRERRAKCL